MKHGRKKTKADTEDDTEEDEDTATSEENCKLKQGEFVIVKNRTKKLVRFYVCQVIISSNDDSM